MVEHWCSGEAAPTSQEHSSPKHAVAAFFVAISVRGEAKALLAARATTGYNKQDAQCAPAFEGPPQTAEQAQAGAEAEVHGELRAQSALMLYRKDYIEDQRALGNRTGRLCSSALWEEVKTASSRLPARRPQEYDRRAVASNIAARANRLQRGRATGPQLVHASSTPLAPAA